MYFSVSGFLQLLMTVVSRNNHVLQNLCIHVNFKIFWTFRTLIYLAFISNFPTERWSHCWAGWSISCWGFRVTHKHVVLFNSLDLFFLYCVIGDQSMTICFCFCTVYITAFGKSKKRIDFAWSTQHFDLTVKLVVCNWSLAKQNHQASN